MLPAHEALQAWIEAGDSAAGLADQDVARSLYAGRLLRRTLIDSRLGSGPLRSAGWTRGDRSIHAAKKAAGFGAQDIGVGNLWSIALQGDVEIILERERDRILQ